MFKIMRLGSCSSHRPSSSFDSTVTFDFKVLYSDSRTGSKFEARTGVGKSTGESFTDTNSSALTAY